MDPPRLSGETKQLLSGRLPSYRHTRHTEYLRLTATIPLQLSDPCWRYDQVPSAQRCVAYAAAPTSHKRLVARLSAFGGCAAIQGQAAEEHDCGSRTLLSHLSIEEGEGLWIVDGSYIHEPPCTILYDLIFLVFGSCVGWPPRLMRIDSQRSNAAVQRRKGPATIAVD
jgi:hypothetical protein